MNLHCADCNTEIPSDNVNISTDLAKCAECGAIHKASDLSIEVENEDLNPPSGSKILFVKGLNGSVEYILPKKGITASTIPQLLFVSVWLGFIFFWTFQASKSSNTFALFSIPFWIVGISMIVGIINSAWEVQIIKLSQYKLTVERKRPILPKLFETDLKDVLSIKMKALKMSPLTGMSNFRHLLKMQKSYGAAPEIPAIITGRKTEYFFDDANDAEQEWITRILSRLLKQLQR